MDERIRLLLDLGHSREEAQRVVTALDGLKASAKGAADTYEVLSTVINKSVGGAGSYQVATDRLNVALDEEVRKAVEATTAHKALAMSLDDMPAHTAVASAGADQLRGKGGAAGYGVMGASYAVQDFVTVVSMGGGWGRAMMSMANNVTPVIAALGLGTGLAAALGLVVTVASTGAMALESWWKAADSDRADSARDKFKELREEAKKANDEFEKLAKAPDANEKLAAEGIKLFLEGKGNAERSRAELQKVITRDQALGHLGAGAQFAYARAAAEGGVDDRTLRGRAYNQEAARLGGERAPTEMEVQGRFEQLQKFRDEARSQAASIVAAGEKQLATKIVTDALKPGKDGDKARAFLMGATRGRKGFEELQDYTPEKIAAAEAEHDEGMADFEGIAESGKRAGKAIKARRKRDKEEAAKHKAEEDVIDQFNRQGGAEAKQWLARDARERKAAARLAAAAARLAAAGGRKAAAAEKKDAAAEAREEREMDRFLDATRRDVERAKKAAPRAQQHAAEDQAARQLQMEVAQQTGQIPDYNQALMAVRRHQQQNAQLHAQLFEGMMGMQDGIAQENQMLRGMLSRMHRGLEQAPGATGLGR